MCEQTDKRMHRGGWLPLPQRCAGRCLRDAASQVTELRLW
jgi:hypothetical protein